MADLARLTPDCDVDAEVVVYSPQTRHTTWHTDPGCVLLRRHRHTPVEIWGIAHTLDSALAQDRRNRRLPCASCALPTLLDLGIRAATSHPDQAVRVAVGCPQSRLAFDDSHRRCRICSRLRTLAGRHDAVSYTDPHGYQLAFLTVHQHLRTAVARAYATHPVPDDVDVTAQLLQVLWATRDRNRPHVTPLPAVKDDKHGIYYATHHLDFALAALLTAPPAPRSDHTT